MKQGKERLEDKSLKGYRFFDSLVMADVGMENESARFPTYYPLIQAGNNWYDCKASCELSWITRKTFYYQYRRIREKDG